MQAEFEAKFLDINHDDFRALLDSLGATCVQPRRRMRRTVFGTGNGLLESRHAWVRVRDEGDKVTMSYKRQDSLDVDGVKEVNITVDDFEEAGKFLEALDLTIKSYQETYRESWVLDGVEIELDEWPWIRPFIEVEAESEDALRAVVEKLGLKWEAALHGSVEVAYQAEYDVGPEEVNSWPEITFGLVPGWLEVRRK